MLTECTKTQWRSGGTFRDVAAVAKARGTDVDNCSAKLSAVKDYQDRQKAEKPTGELPK